MSNQKFHQRVSQRAAASLSAKVERRLFNYAAAAGAAGVGILALSPRADAEIVYTPAYIRVTHNTVLDLNHDGVNDFRFAGYRKVRFPSSSAAASVLGVGSGDQVLGASYASALQAGSTIGPSGKFPGGPRIVRVHDRHGLSSYLYDYGPWHSNPYGIRSRYLGFKFTINGETHYGWARMNLHIERYAFITPVITGYAYETEANKSLRAGQKQQTDRIGKLEAPGGPSSKHVLHPTLGALAGGMLGLELWRREEEEPQSRAEHG